MNKKEYREVTLVVISNEENSIVKNPVISGILSRHGKKFQFQEATGRRRSAARPRIYEGRYVSLVCHENGNYQLYLKKIVLGSHAINPDALIREIDLEIKQAINSINNINE